MRRLVLPGHLYAAVALYAEEHGPAPEIAVDLVDGAGEPGVALLALSIARTLKEMGYKLYIILLKDGELFRDFEECGTVELVPFNDFDKFQSSLSILHKAGYSDVLLNTLLSGSLAPIFHDAGFHVITLVHEMGFSIKQ